MKDISNKTDHWIRLQFTEVHFGFVRTHYNAHTTWCSTLSIIYTVIVTLP